MDDGPLEVDVAAHPHVAAEDGVVADAGAGVDPAAGTEHRRALDPGLGVDLGALPQPDPVAQLEAGHLDLDLAVQHVLVGRHVGLEGADVLPVALGDRPEQRQALVEELREHLAGEVHRPVGLDVLEDLRLWRAGISSLSESVVSCSSHAAQSVR